MQKWIACVIFFVLMIASSIAFADDKSVLANPNVAYFSLLLAVYGLLFEISHPGFLFPGIIGLICLSIAFIAFQSFPTNYTSLTLTLIGLSLMMLEMFIPSAGVMGIGGILAFALGSSLLHVALSLIILMSITSLLYFFMLLTLSARINE